mmetsp:Transcript_30277/g.55496  ORF Transcript_30277/g.55496 Transcript_30277/m.55496 type:complete len:121 (+) Transcript_30277:60-422(+)
MAAPPKFNQETQDGIGCLGVKQLEGVQTQQEQFFAQLAVDNMAFKPGNIADEAIMSAKLHPPKKPKLPPPPPPQKKPEAPAAAEEKQGPHVKPETLMGVLFEVTGVTGVSSSMLRSKAIR